MEDRLVFQHEKAPVPLDLNPVQHLWDKLPNISSHPDALEAKWKKTNPAVRFRNLIESLYIEVELEKNVCGLEMTIT